MDRTLIDKLPRERRECLEQVLELQAAMTAAVEQGDWDKTRDLESRRAQELRTLYVEPGDLDAESGEALAGITRELIAADKALVNQVMAMRSKLDAELSAVRRGQKAVGAYADNRP
ncbi:flagellar protein FliT [Gammaproteobacteria bacterium AB-CW1]|uniref:Flagellar protein FliT n=1 Tax=Natronospira elongata TaxID=3110268 RepID=A0AAP6JCG4_9GAMM|nr:flagellar protein FliT [Gammaproteobacteria bacterium AB-CW1]